MDEHNIGKYIRKLQKERCLIVTKDYNEKGNEFNRYKITSPEFFKEKAMDNGTPFEDEIDIDIDDIEEKELIIRLLA